METFLFILIVIALVLGGGMLKSGRIEKLCRAWVAQHGGKLHRPFVPVDHPHINAVAHGKHFASGGPRLWGSAVEVQKDGRTFCLMEFVASSYPLKSGHWHCMLAESCSNHEAAESLRQQRAASSSSDWIATKRKGTLSASLLESLAAL